MDILKLEILLKVGNPLDLDILMNWKSSWFGHPLELGILLILIPWSIKCSKSFFCNQTWWINQNFNCLDQSQSYLSSYWVILIEEPILFLFLWVDSNWGTHVSSTLIFIFLLSWNAFKSPCTSSILQSTIEIEDHESQSAIGFGDLVCLVSSTTSKIRQFQLPHPNLF